VIKLRIYYFQAEIDPSKCATAILFYFPAFFHEIQIILLYTIFPIYSIFQDIFNKNCQII